MQLPDKIIHSLHDDLYIVMSLYCNFWFNSLLYIKKCCFINNEMQSEKDFLMTFIKKIFYACKSYIYTEIK